ncbi:hypothetical protein ACFZAV_45385 [Streptomyces sp. NPDC008343]|uniref:hypothetical protein n=1 Tax=Streptomyces sp. NPDC008343 TaxID=3364828 RepID=UPI0036E76BBF
MKYMKGALTGLGAAIIAISASIPASASNTEPLPDNCTGDLSARVSITNHTDRTYHFRGAQPGPGIFMSYPDQKIMSPGSTVSYVLCTENSQDELKGTAFWSKAADGDFQLASLVSLLPSGQEFGLNDFEQGKSVGKLLDGSITTGNHVNLKWELEGDQDAIHHPGS